MASSFLSSCDRAREHWKETRWFYSQLNQFTNINGNITRWILESSTFLLDNRVYEPVLPLRLLLDKRYCYIFFILFLLPKCFKSILFINKPILQGGSVSFFMHHTLGTPFYVVIGFVICSYRKTPSAFSFLLTLMDHEQDRKNDENGEYWDHR